MGRQIRRKNNLAAPVGVKRRGCGVKGEGHGPQKATW